MESPEIPFFGGAPDSKLDLGDMAAWVKPEDKVPLLLAISLYSEALQELQGYQLVPGSNKVRVAAWFNTSDGHCIIGCRGTQALGKQGSKDIKDDTVSLFH